MKRQQQSLGILILTFIIVVTWVSVHFYEVFKTSTISSTLQIQITPIVPTFDQATLTALIKRKTVAPLYIESTPAGSSSAVVVPPQSQALIPTIAPLTPVPAPQLTIPQSTATFPGSSQGGVLR